MSRREVENLGIDFDNLPTSRLRHQRIKTEVSDTPARTQSHGDSPQNVSVLQELLEVSKSENKKLLQKLETLRVKVDTIQSEYKILTEKYQSNKESYKKLKITYETTRSDLHKLKEFSEKLQTRILQYDTELNEKELHIQEFEERANQVRNTCETAIAEKDIDISELEKRLNTQRSLNQRFEQESAEQVQDLEDKIHDLQQTIVDLSRNKRRVSSLSVEPMSSPGAEFNDFPQGHLNSPRGVQEISFEVVPSSPEDQGLPPNHHFMPVANPGIQADPNNQINMANAEINTRNLPFFNGEGNSNARSHLLSFDDWLCINNKNDPKEKYKTFALTLKGKARLWFEKNKIPNPTIATEDDWKEIRRKFEQRFSGYGTSDIERLDYWTNLAWNSSTPIDDYADICTSLGKELKKTDLEVKIAFRNGLPVSIAKMLFYSDDLDVMIEKAKDSYRTLGKQAISGPSYNTIDTVAHTPESIAQTAVTNELSEIIKVVQNTSEEVSDLKSAMASLAKVKKEEKPPVAQSNWYPPQNENRLQTDGSAPPPNQGGYQQGYNQGGYQQGYNQGGFQQGYNQGYRGRGGRGRGNGRYNNGYRRGGNRENQGTNRPRIETDPEAPCAIHQDARNPHKNKDCRTMKIIIDKMQTTN